MPPTGRLSDEQIADLAAWVDAGATWPAEQTLSLPDPSEAFDLERRRQEHWAWRPVGHGAPPSVADTDWPQSTVDRYILAKLEQKGLKPAPAADRYTLLRRLSFALTGLPPSPQEIAAFASDDSPRAVQTVVERLLASPHFGERWARRWMDLFRYTESHGSEGDPDLPEAWRYRDYLIRALNADVPYDQLIREHIAGDLLAEPRHDTDRGLNESLLGTAHYRMIEHGFQPVDPWEDRVKWTDNQNRCLREGVPRADHIVREMPRSQVRRDQPARLLRAIRHLCQRAPRAAGGGHAGLAATQQSCADRC